MVLMAIPALLRSKAVRSGRRRRQMNAEGMRLPGIRPLWIPEKHTAEHADNRETHGMVIVPGAVFR